MTLSEKQELLKLLYAYQTEMIQYNEDNIAEAARWEPKDRWKGDYKYGAKGQFEHARIIAAKLAVEIGKELKSNYEI